MMMHPPPSAPPGPEAALMPDPGPGEVPAAADDAPLPALREVVEPSPQQAPIPVAEASGQHFQDLAPAELPKLYLPLPVSTDRKGKGDTRIKQRLRSTKEPEKGAPLQMPLRVTAASGSGGRWPLPSEPSPPLTEARKWLREMAPEGTANLSGGQNQPPPMRDPVGTVTGRKGGAAWRDIGQLFTRSQDRISELHCLLTDAEQQAPQETIPSCLDAADSTRRRLQIVPKSVSLPPTLKRPRVGSPEARIRLICCRAQCRGDLRGLGGRDEDHR
ncbi:hypothetical protein Celaphus_00011595 [Cervus elaphus hippelaphus]|uniref:Uncharacterized protein n=1 Tax=Cervus elaphus hippelaphus TaxID=46360 RepID=A0A212DFK6_CEREH|nr:hypothetical protein Celaphus_00011595 [Cervus elaphus hippelaphus]